MNREFKKKIQGLNIRIKELDEKVVSQKKTIDMLTKHNLQLLDQLNKLVSSAVPVRLQGDGKYYEEGQMQ